MLADHLPPDLHPLSLTLISGLTQPSQLHRATQIKTYSWDNAQVILVGNKCDLEDERVVPTEEGRRLADDLGQCPTWATGPGPPRTKPPSLCLSPRSNQSPILCPLKICPEKYLHVYHLLHLIPEDLPTDNLYCPTALGTQTQQNHFWEFILQTTPVWAVTGVSNYSTVIRRESLAASQVSHSGGSSYT